MNETANYATSPVGLLLSQAAVLIRGAVEYYAADGTDSVAERAWLERVETFYAERTATRRAKWSRARQKKAMKRANRLASGYSVTCARPGRAGHGNCAMVGCVCGCHIPVSEPIAEVGIQHEAVAGPFGPALIAERIDR